MVADAVVEGCNMHVNTPFFVIFLIALCRGAIPGEKDCAEGESGCLYSLFGFSRELDVILLSLIPRPRRKRSQVH